MVWISYSVLSLESFSRLALDLLDDIEDVSEPEQRSGTRQISPREYAVLGVRGGNRASSRKKVNCTYKPSNLSGPQYMLMPHNFLRSWLTLIEIFAVSQSIRYASAGLLHDVVYREQVVID